MMDTQLRDVHERGEPIAALWASEETIYGRFGYGLASWAGELKVPHEWDAFAELLELAGTTRFVTPEEAGELFPPIYEAVRRERPGMTSRSETWWGDRQLRVSEDEADAPRRFVVLELDGEPQGYAIYRTHFSFEGGLPASRLVVREALGATPQATAAIWRFLLDVDWMSVVEVPLAPPDHPLFLLLALPRRARYRMHDSLWVRLVDVGAALVGPRVRRGRPARARGARRGLRVERRTLAARRRRVRADGGRAGSRAGRLGARLRVPRRGLVRAASRGAARGRAAGGSGRPRGRAVRVAPAAVVPRDLLRRAVATLLRDPGRLAQLGEHQLDKLGVTGSSPVPPISPAFP